MTEETPTSQVPLLDLAPKLKRPLSLWNPLDYLLLLYWVFYFPQAIHWYVETFCEPAPKLNQLTLEQRWDLIKDSPRKRQLAFMGYFLAISIPILFCFGLEKIGIEINWGNGLSGMFPHTMFMGILISLIVIFWRGVASGVLIAVAWCVIASITSGLWRSAAWWIWNLIWNLVWQWEWRNTVGEVVYSLVSGVTSGLGFGIIISSMLGGVNGISIVRLAYFLPIFFSFFTLITFIIGNVFGHNIFLNLVGILSMLLANSVAILRLDNRWFSFKFIPRITLLKIPNLTRQLSIWLETDWQQGLMNASQLLKYSSQLLTVDSAINNVLAKTNPEKLIERITTLSDLIEDLDIVRYSSTSLKSELKAQFIQGLFWLPYKSWFAKHFNANRDLPFDTVSRAAAGFLYLQEAKHAAYEEKWNKCDVLLYKSVQLFKDLRHINHGEEIYQLASILYDFSQTQSILDVLNLRMPNFPDSEALRPTSWFVIKKLFLALDDTHVVINAKSISVRSFALNRAVGHIPEIVKYLRPLPPEAFGVERPLVINIVDILQKFLLSVAKTIGQVEVNKPISNPYTVGDPVFGIRFFGREDILRQLEELWIVNKSPQSVILYGHRRMGKTSILRNASNNLAAQVRVAYVNLLSIGSAPNGITDILMAICDAIQEVTDIPAPNNNDLFKFPETTFRRYLQHIEKNFTGTGLIIALDEFEKIEELIDAGNLSKDFLGFLRGMVQMSSKLAFAFAGLHTLQEMNADYFQPFYASFIPISVAFLTRDATHQVLANPDPEFLLEYEPAALDHIYDLTNGQPYLTQLIGFQLVRLFNDYVFEQGKPRDRTFTIDDVHTICSGENFFTTGINYFNGVWQQASEGATHQHDILKALAPHPQGLTESELISQTNLPSETLQAALKTLKDHDVIRSQKTNEIVNCAIAVELFRTWVVRYKLSNN